MTKTQNNVFQNDTIQITFNTSDSVIRPKGELYKSVVIQPIDFNVKTGKVIDQSMRFNYRRAALNAVREVWTDNVIVDGMWHLYRKEATNKLTGPIGYVHNQIVPFGVQSFVTHVPGRGMMTVKAPMSKINNQYVLTAKTVWLKAFAVSQNVIELSNGVIDEYNQAPGDALHDMIEALDNGHKIVIDVTFHNRGGKYESIIHGNAVRLLDDLSKPVEQVRNEMKEFRMEQKENKKSEYQSKAAEKISGTEQARPELKKFMANTFTVMMDGKEVALDEIPWNVYVVRTVKKEDGIVRSSYPVKNPSQRNGLRFINTNGVQLVLEIKK